MSEENTSALRPASAGYRFLLEIGALVGWGLVGWHAVGGAGRWALVVLLPLVAATVWGTFRAPGDHSANGGAPVAVHGRVRLAIEFVVLLGAAIASAIVWRTMPATVFGALVVVHYVTTTARVRWLLTRRPTD